MKVFVIYDSLAHEPVSAFISNNFETASRALREQMRGKPAPDISYHLCLVDGEFDGLNRYPESVPIINLYNRVDVTDDYGATHE